MNDTSQFDPQRSAAIRAMLIDHAATTQHARPSALPARRRVLLASGIAVAVAALAFGGISIAAIGSATNSSSTNAGGHAAAAWPTNARGQTYGAQGSNPFPPDLVKVTSTDGDVGYVYSKALRQALALRTASPAVSSAPVILPVYRSNGTTKIGDYEVPQ